VIPCRRIRRLIEVELVLDIQVRSNDIKPSTSQPSLAAISMAANMKAVINVGQHG
jgi:hypothetical protein